MASKTSANKIKVGITLSSSTLKRLEEKSEELGISKSAYISMIINREGGKRTVG